MSGRSFDLIQKRTFYTVRHFLVKFQKTHQQRQITKAMSHVPQKIKAVKAHAINEVFKKDVDELDENAREVLERVLSYMEKRCISIPMEAAKNTVS